nr:MAG TPA: hypothetical protein [Caudoviricetes sp.]
MVLLLKNSRAYTFQDMKRCITRLSHSFQSRRY